LYEISDPRALFGASISACPVMYARLSRNA
jgi:hypothetical protein